MAKTRFKYLKPEDIRKLAGFEFAPRALVEGYLSGRHRSLARGSSIEFRDYRQYVPGGNLPIAFAEWGYLGKGWFQRRDFRFDSLTLSSAFSAADSLWAKTGKHEIFTPAKTYPPVTVGELAAVPGTADISLSNRRAAP